MESVIQTQDARMKDCLGERRKKEEKKHVYSIARNVPGRLSSGGRERAIQIYSLDKQTVNKRQKM